MHSKNLRCPICLQDFDLSVHLPKISPHCGHTVCSDCLGDILKTSDPKCPLDNKKFGAELRDIESFPTNFALKGLIEESPQWAYCKVHNKKAKLMCLADKCSICAHCAKHGDHQGHKVRAILDIKPDMDQKRRELKTTLININMLYHDINKVLEDRKLGLLKRVKERFDQLRFLVRAKEAELTLEINNFFDCEKELVNLNLGNDGRLRDLIKDSITTTFEDQIKAQGPISLLNEDLLNITSKFTRDLHKEHIQRINQKLDELTAKIDVSLVSRINSLRSVDISSTDILGKLYNMCLGEVIQNSPRDLDISLPCLSIKGPFELTRVQNQLEIKTINHEVILKREDWKSLKSVKLTLDKFDFSKENLKLLSFIMVQMEQLQSVTIVGEKQNKFTEGQLINLFAIAFWRPEALKEIKINFRWSNIGDQSMLFLAQRVLARARNLRTIDIQLRKTEITDRSIYGLSKHIKPLLPNLKVFALNIAETNVTEQSIMQVFSGMPALTNFSLCVGGIKFGDKSLEILAKQVLPSINALKNFELWLWRTQVTDESVTKLFASIKGVKKLRLYLNETKVTNKSMEEFFRTFPNIRALSDLDLNLDNTKVTEQFKTRIQEVRCNSA